MCGRSTLQQRLTKDSPSECQIFMFLTLVYVVNLSGNTPAVSPACYVNIFQSLLCKPFKNLYLSSSNIQQIICYEIEARNIFVISLL